MACKDKEEARAYGRAYREANREKRRAYREANREALQIGRMMMAVNAIKEDVSATG